MPQSPVPFAPETLDTIQRAFRIATERRHDSVSLEHLFLAITEETQARRLLFACGVQVDVVVGQLEEVLERAFSPVPEAGQAPPEPTLGVDRVIQQAVVHAAVSSEKSTPPRSTIPAASVTAASAAYNSAEFVAILRCNISNDAIERPNCSRCRA